MFRKRAHGHYGGQENRQGKGQGHKAGRGIKDQFSYDPPFQPFADQIVYVEPEELHDENKLYNQKGHHQRQGEGLDEHGG